MGAALEIPEIAGPPVEVAKQLVPLLTDHDAWIDENRRLPDAVVTALIDSGLPWMMLPRRVGGAGETMRTQLEVIAELARGSAGAAWALGLVCSVTAMAASLPEEARQLIFRTGREIVCGVTMPIGVARPVDGGYSVSGSWPYASGSQLSDWGMGGLRVLNDKDELVDIGFAFMPIGDEGLSIRDTWHVAGMRGSGSNNIVAEALFVPAELVILKSYRAGGAGELSSEPRDNWPTAGAFPLSVLAPTIGAARNMLDRTVAGLGSKAVSMWDYPRQSESQAVLQQVGEAAMEIESAWLLVLHAADILDVEAQDHFLSTGEAARLQADCGYAMALLRRAADRLMDIGGASAFASSNPLQRAWRDIALGSRHAALNSLQSLELLGRSLAGAPLHNPAFRELYPNTSAAGPAAR